MMKKQLDNWVFSLIYLTYLLLQSYLITQKYTHEVALYFYFVFCLCVGNFFLEYCLNRKLSLQQKAIPFSIVGIPVNGSVLAYYLFFV